MNLKRLMLILIMNFLLTSCGVRGPELHLDSDHPRLYEIAGTEPLRILDIERIRFNNISYAAVVLEGECIDVQGSRELYWPQGFFLFRLDETASVLIWEECSASFFLDSRFLSYSRMERTGLNAESWRGFADRNGNDLPDLAFVSSVHGTGYDCGSLRLLELTMDGGTRDITPVEYPFNPQGFVNVDEDDQLEVVATRFFEFGFGCDARACSPFALRFYNWNGEVYEDISMRMSDFYEDEIAKARAAIESTYGQPLKSDTETSCGMIMSRAATILFHYEAMGRLEEGWQVVVSLTDVGNWDTEGSDQAEIEECRTILENLRLRVEAGNVVD